MKIFYNIFVNLLIIGMKIGSLFNEKLRKGIIGRKESLKIVREKFSPSDKIIWMHAASLGEYEQGVPVLEKLKEQYPQYKILITFFSPSGYDNVIKKQNIADAVCYLPFDKRSVLKPFVECFSTEIFITVKYEYWYNLLSLLHHKNVKTYVISALFYPKQVFFKPYGKWFISQLKQNIDWFFHQTEESFQLAKTIGLGNALVAGDTRFDRVKQIKNRDNTVPFIDDFKERNQLVVFGSAWEAEERIAYFITKKSKNTKVIIAPHDLKRVDNLLLTYADKAIRYSQLSDTENIQLTTEKQVLIIDSIGLLSKIYSYGDIAVVGGGFHSAGLHNILEAATFGMPVIFGDQYRKNPEADALIAAEGAKSFHDEFSASEFILKLLKNPELLKKMSQNSAQFINQQPDSSKIILEKIIS